MQQGGLLNRLEILEHLGSGGYGEVHQGGEGGATKTLGSRFFFIC